MPAILSHRGNLAGPSAAGENRLPAVRDALALGWGVEIDIRRNDEGLFYVASDPQQCVTGLLAADFCALFRASPHAIVALNIRELGDEAALLAFLEEQGVIDQVFLSDAARLEPPRGDTAARIRALHPHVRIAVRASDRGATIEQALADDSASVVWIDETRRAWCTERDIRRVRDAGRRVYVVSPDLRGRSFAETRARWQDVIGWEVDGICTNYPAALARFAGTAARHAA